MNLRFRKDSLPDVRPAERSGAQRSFDRESARVNLDRMPLALVVLAMLHLLHVVVFFAMVTGDGSREDTWRTATGAAHGIMVPIALGSAWFVRRLRSHAARWSLVPPIYAALYMTFGAIITGLDQLAAATPIAYVITAIGLALFFRLRKRESVTVFGLGAVVMLIGVETWQLDPSLQTSVEMNCITTSVVAFLISRSNMRLHRQIWEDRRIILAQARTDSLTGVLTRGAFLTELQRIIAKGQGGAVALIDIDDLKTINDVGGHAAGDAAIVSVCEAVRGSVRSGDLVGRLGGDELAIFLPNADAQVAATVAERVRFTAERRGTTISVGIACSPRGEPADRWLARADQAMYRAKRGGRNRVKITSVAGVAAILL